MNVPKKMVWLSFGIALILFVSGVYLAMAEIEVIQETDYIQGWVKPEELIFRTYTPLQIKVYVDSVRNIFGQPSEVCVFVRNIEAGETYFNSWLGGGESTGLYNPGGDQTDVTFSTNSYVGDVYIKVRVVYYYN